jgi:hypothetical protein
MDSKRRYEAMCAVGGRHDLIVVRDRLTMEYRLTRGRDFDALGAPAAFEKGLSLHVVEALIDTVVDGVPAMDASLAAK